MEIHPTRRLIIVIFILPTAWKIFSKDRLTIITTENAKAIVEYCVPSVMTSCSFVNILRNTGINGIHNAVITMPWIILKSIPCVAAVFAFLKFFAPSWKDICALIPTPKPIAIALIKFCTGYTRDNAVMASSLIFATKKLSTMLYSEFTSMDSTIGRAIDANSGSTGFSFIKVLFILFPFL